MDTQIVNEVRPKFRLHELLAGMESAAAKAAKTALLQNGITRNMLTRIRQTNVGDAYSPNVNSLRTIAEVLKVSMEDLFTNPNQQ